MATLLTAARPALSFQSLRLIARPSPFTLRRALSTLPNNEHIYVHNVPNSSTKQYLLSYLPNEPPIASLAIGTTTQVPPTSNSLQENPEFLQILHWVIKDNAANDPEVQAQAAMYASSAGSSLGSGGTFFPANHPSQQRQRRKTKTKEYGGGGGTGGDGAGGASAQGGMGGAGRGGYIHVSDQRYPPDFGRVAYPEDIFGSLELDSHGNFVDGTGRYQAGNTYRVVTNEGILGLSAYLRERLVEKLKELDAQARQNP
ncbi:hypothetical protein CKM354_000583800 [Cercospora kikuchii]|uniref:Uncharacterized protein n=1 Tax=Cercospora kikuchii TaxID=84275 RepID=A0A9P3CIB5_9PEZI|nr:uncharacterized protein CKM354_000583800 [Cercospora kikuchii]GIZ42576.1 hypothetical protein CKM354_000583800 [Cercospora kikuchii]